MSYRTATDRIIAIIEGLQPSEQIAGVPNKFRHNKTRTPSNIGRTFQVRSGPQSAVLRNLFEQFERVDLSVEVSYQIDENERELDILIQQDRVELSRALLDAANWDLPNSGIVNTALPDEELMLADLEEIDGDDTTGPLLRLALRFPLEHK